MKKILTIFAVITLFVVAAMAKSLIVEMKSGEEIRLRTDDIKEIRFGADIVEVELPADPYPSATDFSHRNLIMDHTGTQCQYCPLMVMAIDELSADATYADNFTVAAVHSYYNDPMATSLTREITNVYANNMGYPYATINLKKTGHSATTNVKAIADKLRADMAADNAAVTPAGVSSAARLEGNTLKLTLAAKAAVNGEYRVGAIVLESGIKATQVNGVPEITGDRDFNTHNNVVRTLVGRDTDGEFSGISLGMLSAGQAQWTSQSVKFESSWKLENCRLLIYVSQLINGKYVCVNSAYAPINGDFAFEYKSGTPTTDTYVTLYKKAVEMDAEGGDITVPFNLASGATASKVKVSTKDAWIKNARVQGANVVFAVDPNTADSRTGHIAVTYEGCRPIDITVQQAGVAGPAENLFTIETEVISPYAARVTYTPNGYQDGYIHLVAKASAVDAYIEAGNIQGWIEGDIEWLKEIAANNNMTFEKLLSVYKQAYSTGGEPITMNYKDLKNNTEYYAYCYGLTPQGEVTTEFYKQKFTTAIVNKVDLTLTGNVQNIGADKADIYVTPSNNDNTYFWTYVSEMDMAKYDLNQIMDNMIANIMYEISQGASINDIIHKGPSSEKVTGLWKGTKYSLVGWGMDEMGTPTTEPVNFGEFTTKAEEVAINCSFELTTPEIRDNDILLHVKPSRDDVKYYTAFVDVTKCYGYNNEQMAQRLINMEQDRLNSNFYGAGVTWETASWMYSGERSLWGRKDVEWTFSPNKTYRIFVFGIDNTGKRTTDVAVIERTTMPAPASDLTVDIKLDKATWNKGTFTFTPSNEDEYYIPLLVATEEMQYVTKPDGSLDEALLSAEIESYYDNTPNYYTHRGTYTQDFRWISDTDFTMLVCGWSGGNTTRFFRLDTHTPKLEFNSEADVECTYEQFDGSELAEIDYNRWKDYRGNVVLRLKLKPNDKAANYFAGVWMPVSNYQDVGGVDYLVLLDQNPSVSIVNRPSALYRNLCYDDTYSLSYFAQDAAGNFGPWHYVEITPKRGEIDEAYDFWTKPAAAPEYIMALSPEGTMKTISKPAGAPELKLSRKGLESSAPQKELVKAIRASEMKAERLSAGSPFNK